MRTFKSIVGITNDRTKRACREASNFSRGSRARHPLGRCRWPTRDLCRHVVGPSGEQGVRPLGVKNRLAPAGNENIFEGESS